jgi:hypothetical protein
LTAAGCMMEAEEKAEGRRVFSPGNLTTRSLTQDKFRRTVIAKSRWRLRSSKIAALLVR